MSWTTSADLRVQVQRLWDRGELLRASVSEAVVWPLRLTLKAPAANDLSDRFEAVRDWVRAVAGTPHVRIEWRDWTHRVQGKQRLPAAVWLDSLQDALAVIEQARAAERYQALWQQAATAQPALLPWLSKRPLQVLDLADRWDRLLAVVAWLRAHPRPTVYLRQVDMPGVDSKFIESHRGVLAEWLDLALPPEAIDAAATGVAQFAHRYGFLDKPVRLRFRLLDPTLPSLPGCQGLPDVTLDAASFAELTLPVARVFITENETNFLAFPPVAKAIVIFGAGYGWESLTRARWLHSCDLCYWGDIDTHGFAILDQLRSHFPQVASFLMDRETLLTHRAQWGEEPEPARHDLARLTIEEAALYDELRFDRIQPRLRLEQERIGYRWFGDSLNRISATSH
ncbi:DUF2220 family protein [Aquabacterium sp. A7-Y]|uniref:Wadjet anti-phage system protein JetD domain-containing protein n=1 Tax=Aquabacterium sp. A7-Y TaxID=1349605 RepID=UPI00223D5199|nr:Wadjet anti-phage system protein JetD domain-containing protein [Aquabacterium sp. A7-Y]MCW7541986.1 DUF2220 family protein [Aquabacterium sp. A7-Y]